LITFIANLRVPAQNAQAFEELMAHVTASTLENEPGVLYYGFAKSVEDAEAYVVVEVYRDQAACAAHGENAWVRDSVPTMLQLTEGMPQLVQYVSPGADGVASRFEDMT
jgi:quinol monooxygenase YgiN